MSFAQRMMQKMGHIEGRGLGASGTGIVTPIAVKLRPQGAGVGSVKEKTPQQKAEERRAAEQRGEEYVDSEEEERQERRRRKEAIRNRAGTQKGVGGRSQRGPGKTKVRTVSEIEAEEGLKVPDVFKAFIDFTGAAPRQIGSAEELSRTTGAMQGVGDGEQARLEKLVRNARIELEAFASTWRELQERKGYCDVQVKELSSGPLVEAQARELEMRKIEEIAEQLSSTSLGAQEPNLELLKDLRDQGTAEEITELISAVIDPVLVTSLAEWDPLSAESPDILSQLRSLKGALFPADMAVGKTTNHSIAEEYAIPPTSKQLHAYESMMFTRWLPKIRTCVTNDWNPHDPQPMLKVLEDWTDVLPAFLRDIFVNQLITAKLIEDLKAWKPHHSSKSHSKHSSPQSWLFPWLQHLNAYHMDPRSATGLLAEVKRRFRAILTSWNPNKGTVPDLDAWLSLDQLRPALENELTFKLLPRLAQYLRDELVIDPANQDPTPIHVVLQWQGYFSVPKFARVFVDAFFPKWASILHIWLTSDPNYKEVGQWYEWWHSVFPDPLNADPAMEKLWNKGLEMMTQAMEMGPEHVKDLAEPSLVEDAAAQAGAEKAAVEDKAVDEEPASMKEILEELCEQDDLLLLPLRKAHPETGHPLFRITASASGSGGVVVYIVGDVVMAQNKRDRALWEPLDVFAEGILPRLAEMR